MKGEEPMKVLFSIVAGAIVSFSQKYSLIIIFVIAAIVFDVITGIVAELATENKLSSAKGRKGFWKKVTLLLALCFGFFLDVFIPFCIAQIHIQIPTITCFGMMVGCYIILNELISIFENLTRSNPNIMPTWIIHILTDMKKQIEQEDDKEGKLHRSNGEEAEHEKIRD